MIDKIKVHTKDYTVADNPKLELGHGKVNLSTGETTQFHLFKTVGGQSYYGSKAYWNNSEPEYNLTIDNRGLFLQFNPAVIYHGCNYFTVTEKELPIVYALIEKTLHENGISLNLQKTTLSRIDLAKNIHTDNKVKNYSPLFESLQPVRGRRVTYDTNYYRYGNQSRQIVFYDKISELGDHWKRNKSYWFDRYGINPELHTLRGELRLLNKRTVEGTLKFSELNDTCRDGSFEYMFNTYKQQLDKQVFKPQTEQLQINFEHDLELIKHIKKHRKQGISGEYLKRVGIDYVIKRIGSLENYRTLWELAGTPDRTIRWILNEAQTLIAQSAQFPQQGMQRDNLVSDMYHEIYSKFVA